MLPTPPKNCFATNIAKADAIITAQIGVVGGQENANNIPVTTQLQSLVVSCSFLIFCHIYSDNTHVVTAVRTIIIELIPKK